MIAADQAAQPSLRGWAGRLRRWLRWHPEWTAGTVALTAWAWLLMDAATRTPHHGHVLRPLDGREWLSLQGHWVLMTVAMMLPATLPMARVVARNSKSYRRQRAIFLFAGSSLLIWIPFGLVVATASAILEVPGRLVGICLVAAAAWELTPSKRRALKACHRLIPLPPDGRKADRADISLGLGFGRACFKACWALMLPMALAAPMSLFLMIMVSVVATAEELVVKGYRLAPPAAVVLAVAGLMVLVLG